MKIQISNIIKDDMYFNMIIQCLDSFLTYEARFGLFNLSYKDNIFQIIEDFKIFNHSRHISNIALELFVHDYTFLSKYKNNPSLYIPIDDYKKSAFFQIDISKHIHVSVENFSGLFVTHAALSNGAKNISTQHIKDNYVDDFKKLLFSYLIFPQIESFPEMANFSCVDDLSDEEILIIKMLSI